MVQVNVPSSATQLSLSERWAAYVARHTGGVLVVLAAMALAVAFVVMAIVRDVPIAWGFGALWLLIALMYWERGGFKRLLARRDEEIEQLRSRERSA